MYNSLSVKRFPQLTLALAVFCLLLCPWRGSAGDVLIIRVQVQTKGNTSYNYYRSGDGGAFNKTDSSDALSVFYTGETEYTLTNNLKKTIAASQLWLISGGGSLATKSREAAQKGDPPPPTLSYSRSWSYSADPAQYNPTNSSFSVDVELKAGYVTFQPPSINDWPILENSDDRRGLRLPVRICGLTSPTVCFLFKTMA